MRTRPAAAAVSIVNSSSSAQADGSATLSVPPVTAGSWPLAADVEGVIDAPERDLVVERDRAPGTDSRRVHDVGVIDTAVRGVAHLAGGRPGGRSLVRDRDR